LSQQRRSCSNQVSQPAVGVYAKFPFVTNHHKVMTVSCSYHHHHHHHIYFRLPERPQKPIELATIKQHKESCKNEKKYKKVIKNDFKNIKYIKEYAARPKQTSTTT